MAERTRTGARTDRTRAAQTPRSGAYRAATLAEPGSRGVTVLLVLAVLLFAMVLRGEHILVSAAGDPAVAAIQVATFLSSVLLAALLLGGAAGASAIRLFAGRDGTRLLDHGARRALFGTLGGLVAGIVAGGAGYLLEADLSTADRLVVGAGVATAALLGGAATAIRPGLMTVAGYIGTVVVIAVLALRSLFLTPLTRLFGGEGTIAKYAQAQSNLALVSFIVAGIIAGVAVHLYVRRTGNRLGTAANVAAGATPGVLALVAQLLTWAFGSSLISSAGGLDLGDTLAFQLAGRYQLNGSLALLFAGALVAVLLYGRTRGPRRPRTRTPAAKPDWAVREERRAAEIDRAARQREADAEVKTDGGATDDKPSESGAAQSRGATSSGTEGGGAKASAAKNGTSRGAKTSAAKNGTSGGAKPSDAAKPSGGKNGTSGAAKRGTKTAASAKQGAKSPTAKSAAAKPSTARSANAKPAESTAGGKSAGAKPAAEDRGADAKPTAGPTATEPSDAGSAS
ncbi:hypothetical protein [Actinocatenispora rupis]|uniref:Uncharacterized protein n=1 Tax=Actinocatenispora rupis TaxID=519421 RepID=A0A8J3IVE2_9ACTN|nr:hypothetical protein [Actinocatenispora rupis]GID10661.1 hypothetical protein Aru02nite_15500 [Actinocatenispora rupis]